MVICVEQGANELLMIQLMPLPSHCLLLRKNTEQFYLSASGFAYPG